MKPSRDPDARLRRPAVRFTVLLFFVIAPPSAFGARPLDTEDTAPLAPGRGELEVGADYARGDGTVLARCGAVVVLNARARVDAGIAFGLTDETPDLLLTTGLTMAVW